MDVLDQLPIDARDVVLKCHGMDQRLLKFVRVADAKLMITTRDPRDSVVSQRERFGLSLQQAAVDISRPIATIGSLPADVPVLRFAYEGRFFDQSETIAKVAHYLDLKVDDAAIDQIFASLSPEAVRSWIARRLAAYPVGHDPGHDPITQWHTTHIGDGRSGKWRDRLDPAGQKIVSESLCVLSGDEWQHQPLTWSARLFTCPGAAPFQSEAELSADAEGDFLCYGPYLCLPRGRWRASALLRAKHSGSVSCEADIHRPWDDQEVACWQGEVSASNVPSIILEFDHYDHYQPVEARIRRKSHSPGTAFFAGWQLSWLGAL